MNLKTGGGKQANSRSMTVPFRELHCHEYIFGGVRKSEREEESLEREIRPEKTDAA